MVCLYSVCHLDHTLMKKNQKRFSMSYANNVCERSLFCNVFEIFSGMPSTTHLVATLNRNDRFAIGTSLYRTDVKIIVISINSSVALEPFFVSNLFLYVLSSRERTKAPGTRKNQSQQPSAHESQATSFVRLLFDANSFSFNHRGQKNSLFTQ